MKKTISIVVALAMVFVMSFSAFAAEKPTDVPADATELGTYYAELLNAEDADTVAVAQEIIADYEAGLYTIETLPDVLGALMENSNDADAAVAVVEQVLVGLEEMGAIVPEEDDETTTGGEDETLADDEDEGDDSSFLNTILGILGTIGDMIFGSDDSTGGDDTTGDDGDDEDLWGDDGDDSFDNESDDLVSNTGDTTVISVAAVALVAGAALVLTRKKSEDAE